MTDKLRKERVYHVISLLLVGEGSLSRVLTDDLQYVEDLGLITLRPGIAIANCIYAEVIPRELAWFSQL